MPYEDRIRKERNGMSRSFARLADFLLDSYVEASFMTASELAQTLNLDAATVVRFSQSLGYEGFPQLQREIRQRVKDDLLLHSNHTTNRDSLAGIIYTAMNDIILELERTRITLDMTALDKICEMIGKSSRVIVMPEAPAIPSAYNLVAFMEQGGFHVYIARTSTLDLARALHTSTQQDMILALDISGQNDNITHTIELARKNNIPTTAIVATASLPSARAADAVIAAQSNLTISHGIVTVNALVYLLSEALRWRYSQRFAGAEQAIANWSKLLQVKA